MVLISIALFWGLKNIQFEMKGCGKQSQQQAARIEMKGFCKSYRPELINSVTTNLEALLPPDYMTPQNPLLIFSALTVSYVPELYVPYPFPAVFVELGLERHGEFF